MWECCGDTGSESMHAHREGMRRPATQARTFTYVAIFLVGPAGLEPATKAL